MATQFFLPSSGAAAVSPSFDAGWEDTSIASRLRMPTARVSSAMATVAFDDASGADADVLFRQFVSDPISAQTISAQTISLQIRCSEATNSNNMFLAWNVRVVSNDGSTVRGTCVAIRRDGTEAVLSLTNRGDSATSTQVVAQSGDRIVVEIGMGGDPVSLGQHDSSLRFGDSNGTLLPSNDTATTDNDPWIQFANTLTFQTFAPPSVVTATASVGVAAAYGGLPVVTNVRGWWKADALSLANNDPVASWTDSSSAGLNMAQGTGGNQPTFKTGQVNGLPAVDFDGSTDHLSNANSLSPTTGFWTAFAVVKLDSVTGTHAILDADREGGARLAQLLRTDGTDVTTIVLTDTSPNVFSDTPGATLSTGTWYILEAVYDGSSIEAFVNGTGNGSTATTGMSPLSDGGGGSGAIIGAHLDSGGTPSTWFDGLVAEIVAYSDAKSSGDRTLIRNYLATKYGFSATVTPSVVTATGSVGAPAINVPATPSVVTATGSVGAPVVKIAATPATVTATATVSVGTAVVATATLTPTVVTAVGSVGAPTISAAATVTPSVVTAVGSVGAPTIRITTFPSVVTATVSVGAPTVTAGSAATASTVTAVGSVGTPAVVAGATPTPVVPTAVVSVPYAFAEVPRSLADAAAWWVAKEHAGSTLNEQVGSHDAVGTGVTFGDDGTYHYVDIVGDDIIAVPSHADFDFGTEPFTVVAVAASLDGPGSSRSVVGRTGFDFDGSYWALDLFEGGTFEGVEAFVYDINLDENVTVDTDLATVEGQRYAVALVRSGGAISGVIDGNVGPFGTLPVSPAAVYDSDNDVCFGRLGAPEVDPAAVRFYGAAIFKGFALTPGQTADIGQELLAADELSSDTEAQPTVVVATGSVGAPAISATAEVSPSVVTAGVSVPSAAVTTTGSSTPSVVTAVVTVGAPTVTAAADVAAAVVTAVVTVGAPTITATGTAAPGVVVAVVTVGAPAISASATATPAVVVAAVTVGSPTIDAGESGTATPAVVTAVVTVGSPSISAAADVPVSLVVAVVTVGAPAITASALVLASTVTAVVTVGSPVLLAVSYAAPSTVTAIGLVGTPAITAGATVVPQVITAIASVGVVGIITPVLEALFLHSRRYSRNNQTTYSRDNRADYIRDNRRTYPVGSQA